MGADKKKTIGSNKIADAPPTGILTGKTSEKCQKTECG